MAVHGLNAKLSQALSQGPPDGLDSYSLDRFCVSPYLKLGPEFQVNLLASPPSLLAAPLRERK